MKQAVENCNLPADLLLIDGNQRVDHPAAQWTIVGGDGKSLSIAAASVLAKVTRDRIMQEYHQNYPEYEFDRHKGYPTKRHREKIRQFGPCPIHRKTFKGVKETEAADGRPQTGKSPWPPLKRGEPAPPSTKGANINLFHVLQKSLD